MNIFLWVIQILLSLYSIIGAVYMLNNYKAIAIPSVYNSLPHFFWIILGLLHILFALGLVLPGSIKTLPKQTVTVSAAVVAVISFLGIFLYSAYTGFPAILWGLIPAALAAFVAYKRWD